MSFKFRLLWKIDFFHINMFHIHIKIYSEALNKSKMKFDKYCKIYIIENIFLLV